MNIENLLRWTQPKELQTRNGPRLLRTAAPDQNFWAIWKQKNHECRAAGLSVGKDQKTQEWQVCWWQQLSSEDIQRKEADKNQPAELNVDQAIRLKQIEPKMLQYQVASVKRMVDALTRFHGALDASDTGTGKTFVALAATVVLGKPVYVVCPKAVIPSWQRAAAHFGIKLAGICNYELLRRGNQPELSVDDEEFMWQLPSNTVIAFDEIHRCKDGKTLNCGMAVASINQGYTVIGLSATSADNPMQMKFSGLLTKLFTNEKGFYPWMMRNGVSRGKFGCEFTGGQKALNKIHHEIFPQHGTRLKIADLGDAFPETQISAEAYSVNGAAEEINRIHDEMCREIQAIEESEANDKGSCILTIMLRARQHAEVLKVPAVTDMIQDAIEEGMSVAVFVNFDDSADAFMDRLKTKCCIRGGQKDTDREANIAAFQADREHVIICNIRAGGVGVSLHGSPTSRRRLAIIFPSFSGQDLKQALGRVWRANGAKSIQRIFFAADTIEEQVCAKVNAKIARIDTLNDGDVSVEGEAAVEMPRVTEIDTTGVVAKTSEPRSQKSIDREEQINKLAEKMNPELITIARDCLQTLAGMCDGARQIDGAGFAKYDVETGKGLAFSLNWTKRQSGIAARMVNRYRGQLGGNAAPIVELVQSIKES